MHTTRRLRILWAVGLVLGIAAAAHAQPMGGTGVLVNTAPMYLFPDATRTPLATIAAGTPVRLLAREGDWYRVEYRDPYLGNRTGYILATNIRVESTTPPPPPTRGPIPGAVRPGAEQAGQPAVPPPSPPNLFDRGFLSINAGYQRDSTAFTATSTFTQNVEQAHTTTNYSGVHPIVGDIAVGGRVWGVIGPAVAVSWHSQITDATVVASLPHPFVFNSPRQVSGVVPGVKRQEVAGHFDAAAILTMGRVQVSVFAGPSVIQVKQGLVTTVTANEVYPYDTATFGSATTVEVSHAHVGYNGGVDASVLLWKYFGVGAIVRYSRADVHLEAPDGVDVTVRAGGLQASGGIRFRF
jgi:hypothetical protein